jgi:hypothetical protein
LEATESASGRLICSRYAAVLGVGLQLSQRIVTYGNDRAADLVDLKDN